MPGFLFPLRYIGVLYGQVTYKAIHFDGINLSFSAGVYHGHFVVDNEMVCR